MSKNEDSSVNADSAIVKKSGQPGFFGELWQQVRLVYRLLMDPEVPIYLKLLPFVAFVYLLLPFDFLPDVVPGLGQLDDLTIILVGAKVFIELAPQDIVARYMQQMGRKDDVVIDQTVEEDDQPVITILDDDNIIEGVIIDNNSEAEDA